MSEQPEKPEKARVVEINVGAAADGMVNLEVVTRTGANRPEGWLSESRTRLRLAPDGAAAVAQKIMEAARTAASRKSIVVPRPGPVS